MTSTRAISRVKATGITNLANRDGGKPPHPTVGPGRRKRSISDLDRALLASRELSCIRVRDKPSKQVGAMSSTHRLNCERKIL
jgi:hypothetical protein